MNKTNLLVCMGILCSCCISMNAKNALVIIAHGAPMNEWNKPVLNLENSVKEQLKEKGITKFDYVRIALMEFSQPSISNVIRDCEQEKIDSIYAIPLFIAPSSHSEQDIPAILGHKFNAQTVHSLKEEKTEFVTSPIPVVLGPTLYYGDILEKVVTERVKTMSKDIKNEGLLLLAHGDPEYIGFWSSMMKRIGKFIEKTTGRSSFDYAFVGMGQSFKEDILKELIQISKTKKRILVQGVYLSSGVKPMAEHSGIIKEQKNLFKGKNIEVVYSSNGILPNSATDVCNWIIERAMEFK